MDSKERAQELFDRFQDELLMRAAILVVGGLLTAGEPLLIKHCEKLIYAVNELGMGNAQMYVDNANNQRN